MTPRRLGQRRRGALLVAAAIIAGALTGCAPSSTDLSQKAAETMQQSVASVAESAAGGDSPTALATLDRLQAQLDRAIADGDVSAARAAAIQSAIDLVRADLQPPAAPEPAPTTVDTGGTDTGGTDTGGTDTGGEPDTGGENTGNENSGPGNNSGNGNGNGNGNATGNNGKGKG